MTTDQHAEADEALNENKHKMIGLAPFLKEIAEPKKARIVYYDGFLLLGDRAINLSNVREIVIAPITEPFQTHTHKTMYELKHVHVGYQILIVYKENVHIVYREYKLSEAYTQELTDYFKGASPRYPIDTKPIIGEAMKQLKAVVDYEFQTLFNTIQK